MEITVHGYDWQTSTDEETGYTTIHCWGLDRDSKPNLLRFHDFDVFCFVELPLFLNNSFIRWEGFKQQLVYEAICYKLGDDRPHRYMFTQKKKLYYYKGKNKTYPMMLLCFHSISSMMACKRKLGYPIKVKGLKSANDWTQVPLKVWETNVPVVRKLLTLKDCKFCQWFKIQGVKVTGEDKISTLENEFVVDWKSLQPIPPEDTMSWLTKPTLLSFDLETYSDRHNAMPDAFCSKHVVYMVSVVFQRLREPETREKIIILYGDCSETKLANVIKVKTEMELIDAFQDLIVKYDPDIVSGYNILGYDNPYLETRLKRRLKEWRPLGRLKDKPSVMNTISWSSSAYRSQEFHTLDMEGRISIDLLPLIRRDFKLPLYNLNFVSNHFLGKGKHDVSAKQMFETFELQDYLNYNLENDKTKIPESFKKLHKGKDVEKEWIEKGKEYVLDEMRKVVDYCVVDSDLVVDLFEKINVWISLISLASIMGITPTEMFTRGTGVRMLSQMYDECTKSNIVLDEVNFPKENYEGGFVFDPTPGIYHNIPCFDFSSLYPTVMCAHNIDHTTAVPPELMNTIPDEECHVIEWDEEQDDSDSEDEDGFVDSPVKKKKKVVKKKTVHHRYKFVKEPVGVMPRLLTRLIAERNKVKKKMKTVSPDDLEWKILEQTQLGIKIICNSFYGSCGSSYSTLRLPFAAAAITAKARESTKKMNAYLESKGHKIVYGDSVTGDTPILISRRGKTEYICIQDLEKDWSNNQGKQYISPLNVQVWSDLGFTDIKYVMRHKTKKRLFVIVTTSGIIKVTEDHSLLDKNSDEISPKDVKVGDYLKVQEHPIEKGGESVVTKATVWTKDGLDAMLTIERLKKKGHNISYDYVKGGYQISVGEETKEDGRILKIIDLGLIDDYVYDLETENHHFSAGVGELVVHNTDSTMPDIGITDPKLAWEKASQLEKELTALYPSPMNIELEMVFFTMLSIKKKKYLCINMDKNGNPIEDPDKMKIRGVVIARRDNCQFQRDFYKETVLKVMHQDPFVEVFNYIVEMCVKLASHSIRWQDLVMIKGLGDHYKSKTYMMCLFASEMEKAGNPMTPGDRIPYLVVKTKEEKMGMKMRTQELFLERVKAGTPEHIDYLLYLEKTIKNGIEQLFQIGYKKELEELDKKYKQMDQDKFFQALEDKLNVGNLGQIRLEGYRKKRAELNNDEETIEWLITDANLTKIAKPLYNYHIKRRKGRGRRISSRIDKEPILMMVRLMKIKEEVMESVRNYVPKKKIIKLKFTRVKN